MSGHAPRMWVGPQGQVVRLDDGFSHSVAVAQDPAAFGVDVELLERLRAWWHEDDFDFDFDHVIALAEHAGWARTTQDVSHEGTLGISSGCPSAARRALIAAEASGHHAAKVEVEISSLTDAGLTASFIDLDERGADRLRRFGRLPAFSVRDQPRYLNPPPADWRPTEMAPGWR